MNSYIVFGPGRNVDEWVGTEGGGKPGADFVIDDPEFLKEYARRKAAYTLKEGGKKKC